MGHSFHVPVATERAAALADARRIERYWARRGVACICTIERTAIRDVPQGSNHFVWQVRSNLSLSAAPGKERMK